MDLTIAHLTFYDRIRLFFLFWGKKEIAGFVDTRIVAECPSHFFRSTPHAKHGPISRSAYFLHVPARPKLHFPTFCLLLGPAHISCVDLTSEESPLACASSVCRSFRPQLASYSPGVLWRDLLIWLLTSLCLGTGWSGDAYGQTQFPGDGTNYSLTAVAPHIPYNPSFIGSENALGN